MCLSVVAMCIHWAFTISLSIDVLSLVIYLLRIVSICCTSETRYISSADMNFCVAIDFKYAIQHKGTADVKVAQESDFLASRLKWRRAQGPITECSPCQTKAFHILNQFPLHHPTPFLPTAHTEHLHNRWYLASWYGNFSHEGVRASAFQRSPLWTQLIRMRSLGPVHGVFEEAPGCTCQYLLFQPNTSFIAICSQGAYIRVLLQN